MSSPWTVAFLLSLSLAFSAASMPTDFKVITTTVSQFEREGHRQAVQIDSQEYAGIAIFKNARSGWMFSKIERDNLFKKDLDSLLFLGKDQRVVEEDKNFLLAVEDYFILQRTSLNNFAGCGGGNNEPFHLVDNGQKYYLMAMKRKLNTPTDEKIIGTFTGNPTAQQGFFYGLDKNSKKVVYEVPKTMTAPHAEVFCAKKPKNDWK